MAVITKGIELCILGFEIIVEISLCFMTAILIFMHFIETTLSSMTKERGKPSKKGGSVQLWCKKEHSQCQWFRKNKIQRNHKRRIKNKLNDRRYYLVHPYRGSVPSHPTLQRHRRYWVCESIRRLSLFAAETQHRTSDSHTLLQLVWMKFH